MSVSQVGKSQIEGLVEALVDSANDREEAARENIFKSIVDIGRRRHVVVLKICHGYLTKHNKLARGHRIIILQLLEKISKQHIDSVTPDLAADMIRLASAELTMSQEVVPEWQTAASALLSTLGMRHAQLVMKELLTKFQPGGNPHFFVVNTLGQLAVSNVAEVVPMLQTVLSRLIPMLGAAKQENMQWVFAYATARFSEAILDYLADEQRATEAGIRSADFEGEAYSIYELLFNVWLQSKESKLRLAVVEAIGYVVHLLSTSQLDGQLPRLIPGVTQLYRKHHEHYYISQGLCMVVDAACNKSCDSFSILLDNLLLMMHQHACIPMDMQNPMTVKNHNEILRCFAVITKAHSNRVVAFLLQKLEHKDDKVRTATLDIIKHLINSCDAELDDKKPLIVSGLKITLHDNSLKVRRVFNQVIIAMAGHHYLSLEGGQLMVEFVVRQCSINPEDRGLAKQLGADEAALTSLRDMSNKTLQLITTTIDHMESVLWPYLLEFVVPVEYSEAVGIVCRCLADIAGKKKEQEAEDYELNFEELVNLPKPPALLARLVVIAGQPHSGQAKGEHVLHCMRALAPNIKEELVELWDVVLPKLLTYLNEQNDKGTWDQKHWEDLMLKFLSRSLDDVDNEEWLMEVGNAMGDKDMLLKYSSYPEEKGFLYKCLGVLMRKSGHKQFVQKHLDMMFATVKHSSQIEREGCAIGTGFSAASHLDTVVQKLEQVTKEDMVRKSKGFFGLSKDKSEADVERIKATVMLCYGYVTFHSPPQLITSRVEVNILRSINPHFAKVRDTVVKQNLIRTIDLIGRALHPDHLKSSDFVFSKRGDLISHLLGYLRAEPTNVPVSNETRSLAISALATLAKLNPKLSPADQFDIVKATTDSVLPLPLVAVVTKKKQEAVSLVDTESMTKQAVKELVALLVTILGKEYSSENLESIFKHLEPWVQSTDEQERSRAMECLLELLKAYLDFSNTNEAARELAVQGQLLGRMIPRCSDPSLAIRQMAIDCIQLTLRIATCTPGVSDQMVDAVSLLRERAEKDEPNSLFSLVNDLSKVLCKKVISEQLWPLVSYLMEGLVDWQGHSSSGACVVLNQITKLRGSALSEKIPDIIDGLQEKLGGVVNPQTRTGTLRCMRTICQQYLSPALTHLLSKPLPWDEHLVSMWQVLVGEGQLVRQVFDQLLEVISLSLPYQEKRKGSNFIRVETATPKAATHAIGVLCAVPEATDISKDLFSRILATLLLRVGVSSTIEPPDSKTKTPACNTVAVEALQRFLESSESSVMLERLEQQSAWHLLEKEDTCPHGLLYLARALAENHPSEVKKTVDALSSSLNSVYDQHRMTVVAFYSELICTLGGKEDGSLAEQIMHNLLGRQVDSSYMVRMYCIRGLGNMAAIGGAQVSQFSTTILSAMLAGMDDREDPQDLITMEAMSGLARIFEQIDEGHVRPILINIALRIRPCFEKPTAAVRAAAFTLFGSLSRFGNGPSEGPFLEQIQTNFVSLLVHLNEGDPVVVAACKGALQKVGPLMRSERVNGMFQKHLKPEESLLYADFLNDLCKLIVQDFPEKVNFYVMNAVTFFKSMWAEVKCNAALFVGYMLGNLPLDKSGLISKEHICEALILLLRDPSPLVRASTAEAMSLLCEY